MSWVESWRDWRFARRSDRRFCRALTLEGWSAFADLPPGVGVLVLLPRAGPWRSLGRALTLYRQATLLDAADAGALATLQATLAAGGAVALVGADTELAEAARQAAKASGAREFALRGAFAAGHLRVGVVELKDRSD